MSTYNYSVHVDSAAYEKMYRHLRFLSRVSDKAAERLYNELNEAIMTLRSDPGSYPIYMQKRPSDIELRYKLCGKRYRIVFEIIANQVFVYDIQDCRQDTDKSLVD
jgi:hypothetical protein